VIFSFLHEFVDCMLDGGVLCGYLWRAWAECLYVEGLHSRLLVQVVEEECRPTPLLS
jgi:hypothetical protein